MIKIYNNFRLGNGPGNYGNFLRSRPGVGDHGFGEPGVGEGPGRFIKKSPFAQKRRGKENLKRS